MGLDEAELGTKRTYRRKLGEFEPDPGRVANGVPSRMDRLQR